MSAVNYFYSLCALSVCGLALAVCRGTRRA